MEKKPHLRQFPLVLAMMLGTIPKTLAANPAPHPLPFRPGEHLEYLIRYGPLRAGYATLAVDEGPFIRNRRTWRIASHAWSNKVIDILYRVLDRNESWMDADGLYSHHFEQDLHEGSYRAQKWIDYDYQKGKFIRVESRKGHETRVEGPLPGPVQDVFSSLYYARTLPLQVGQTYEFLTHSNSKNWMLKLNVLKKERIKINLGEFDCIEVEPLLLSEGIFRHSGRLLVWLTDDDKRIPVFVKSKVTIGAVEAELIKREGN